MFTLEILVVHYIERSAFNILINLTLALITNLNVNIAITFMPRK